MATRKTAATKDAKPVEETPKAPEAPEKPAGEAPKAPEVPTRSKMTVAAAGYEGVNIRERPDLNANVIGTLRNGAPIDVAIDGEWAEVAGVGFVMAKHLA